MAFITIATVTASISVLLLYFVASRFLVWKRLCHISGPPLTGWSKFWLVRHQFGGRLCLDLPAVCDKYGELSRSHFHIVMVYNVSMHQVHLPDLARTG